MKGVEGVDELLQELEAIDRSTRKNGSVHQSHKTHVNGKGQAHTASHPANHEAKAVTSAPTAKPTQPQVAPKNSGNLDDLLAELDLQDLNSRGSASAPSKTASKTQLPVVKPSSLDKLLADLHLDNNDAASTASSAQPRRPSQPQGKADASSQPQTKHTRTPSITTKMKCAAPLLGGSRIPVGRQSGADPMRCDALRCTKCDFKVAWFDDREWTNDVEYLFFRNNFPTEDKLAPKMTRKAGSCAYCCQCSWTTAAAPRNIDYGGDLRWICAGH